MSNILIFKTKLPTLNEYILAERTNKFSGAKFKKKYTDIIHYEALQQRQMFSIDKTKCHDLEIHWTVTDNRTDSDNYFSIGAKILLDGIVSAKLLSGDGRKYIRNISNTIETGEKYSIEIVFKEV